MDTAITDRSAWRSADIDMDRQVHVLAPAHVAELDAVLEQVKRHPGGYLATDASTVRMLVLDAMLEDLHQEVREGAGFVLLRGLPVDRWTKDEVRAMAWTIATRFGRPVTQNAKGQRVADVMDVIKGSASPRGYHSNAELRLHTDPASDLIGLCCIADAKEGGDSMLASAVALHAQMKSLRPDLVDALYAGFPYHRFGEGHEDEPDVTDYNVPVLSITDGKLSCRYGSNRIRGAAEALNQPLTEVQKEALAMFRELASTPEFAITFRMQPGDFLLCNNLTLLHARTTFVDNDDPNRPRHLLRFWLEGRPGFRPLAPQMNFFNRGQCGLPIRSAA